jgi:predicted TIM-barrel fold metal-dependent hydrolase
MSKHRTLPVFDGDGHVLENLTELSAYISREAGQIQDWPFFSVLPSLDGWHRGFLANQAGMQKRMSTSVEGWHDALQRLGAQGAIVYPTAALTIGMIQEPEWAVLVASAYNSWVENSYTRKSDRIVAAGLVSLQDPAAAAKEVERCATQRKGIRTIALPSVNKLHKNLGHPSFWPIYEAAQKHQLPIAIHGSPSWGFGLETMDQFVKVHTLSHPVPLFIQLTDLYFGGVFDEFPKLKFVFLEGGCGWVPWLIERLEYEYNGIFGAKARKKLKRTPRQVLCESDQFWVSVEAGEKMIRTCLDTLGPDRMFYASDYPHEPPEEFIRKELDELLEREDLSEQEKEKLVNTNIRTLLNLEEKAT